MTYSQRGANLNASQLTYKYARAETNCNLTIGLSGESKMSEKVEQKQLAKPDEWSPAKLTLGKRIGKDFRVNWQLYVMFVLPVIYYIIFRFISFEILKNFIFHKYFFWENLLNYF